MTALRFAVLGELASGGMARVELARRVDGPGELVAVKRLHRHLSQDSEFVTMFFDEAHVTAALNHPGVVRLVGFGSDEHGMFLATEFVEGASLAELFDARRREGATIPLEVAAYIGARAAEGLAAAHMLTSISGASLGVVHRDVSPSNILVGCRGEVKVADFGVAKAAFRSTHTAAGVLKGKVHYMSPEYVAGGTVDARSDLFSLGVVLYQLVSGRRPFGGESEAQVMWRIGLATHTPLAEVAPAIDGDFAAIVENLLRKDPRERAPHGVAVAASLDAWLHRRGFGRAEAARAVAEFVAHYGHAQRTTLGRLLCSEADLHPAELTGSKTVVTVQATEAEEAAHPSPGTRVVVRAPAPDTPVAIAATEPPRPPPAPPPRRSPPVALLAAPLVLVILATAAGFALRTRREPVVQEPAVQAPASAPPPSASAVPPADPPPPPVESATAAAPDAGPPARAKERVRPPRTSKPPSPSSSTTAPSPPRACTPLDFDYPRCLKE